MRNSSHNLNFGANLGFAHMHCKKCKEERLHKHCKCVSCGTEHPTSPYRSHKWMPRYGDLNRHQRKRVNENG